MKVGISGHRELQPATAKWVRNSLASSFTTLQITRGFTSLAIGADQIFAAVLLDAGIPFTVVVPSSGYEETFSGQGRDDYFNFLHAASEVVHLPFYEPSESAYMDAGKFIVDSVDVLVAVWNGKPAQGLGGTADIVSYALGKRKSVLHLDTTNLTVREIEHSV